MYFFKNTLLLSMIQEVSFHEHLDNGILCVIKLFQSHFALKHVNDN